MRKKSKLVRSFLIRDSKERVQVGVRVFRVCFRCNGVRLYLRCCIFTTAIAPALRRGSWFTYHHRLTWAVLGRSSLPIPPLLAESGTPCAEIHAASPAPFRALILTAGCRRRRKGLSPGRTTGGPAIHLVSTCCSSSELRSAPERSGRLWEAALGAYAYVDPHGGRHGDRCCSGSRQRFSVPNVSNGRDFDCTTAMEEDGGVRSALGAVEEEVGGSWEVEVVAVHPDRNPVAR